MCSRTSLQVGLGTTLDSSHIHGSGSFPYSCIPVVVFHTCADFALVVPPRALGLGKAGASHLPLKRQRDLAFPE